MKKRKFGIIKITCLAVFIGSIVTPWLIVLLDYIETAQSGNERWFYNYFSWLELQAFCITIIGYNLPAYLLINFIYKSALNRDLIKLNFSTYIIFGFTSYLTGSILFFISGIYYDWETLLFSLLINLPILLIYCLFFHKLNLT